MVYFMTHDYMRIQIKKKTCGKKRMQKMPPWHRYDHLTVLYFKQLPETLFKRYVLLT